MLGVLCERPADGHAPKQTKWEVSLGYRFLPSHRHFIGTVEQTQRAEAGTEIVNRVNEFTFGVSYDLSPRWTLNASIPVLKMYRDQLYPPRQEVSFVGQGDAAFGARVWLFRPPTETLSNIGIGFALKAPTGQYNVMQPATDRQGNPILATVDQSIQPGDSGTGLILSVNAYRPGPLKTLLYFQGEYTLNPRDTSGVSTFRTKPGEEIMSVADNYLYRGGAARVIPWVRGLSASFGLRMEGVPVRDLFGKSNGFRRPGYSLSLDPGVLYARGPYLFGVNVPWAIRRDRERSVSDIANGTHGDAAFADYTLLISVSRRF